MSTPERQKPSQLAVPMLNLTPCRSTFSKQQSKENHLEDIMSESASYSMGSPDESPRSPQVGRIVEDESESSSSSSSLPPGDVQITIKKIETE